jgi:hypothetical protein
VFLGYSNLHKGFKCVDVSSSHVYISRDVIFDKNIFPFSKLHPNVRARLRDDILMLPSSLIPSGLVHSGVNNTDEPMINLPNPAVQSRFLVRCAQKLMLIMPRCFATYQDLTLKLSHTLRQMLISKSMSLCPALDSNPEEDPVQAGSSMPHNCTETFSSVPVATAKGCLFRFLLHFSKH